MGRILSNIAIIAERSREGVEIGCRVRVGIHDMAGPMKAELADPPSLMVDAGASPSVQCGVRLHGLDSTSMGSLGRYMEAGGALASILRVTVVGAGAAIGDDLPDVFGRYEVLHDGVRFIPLFPFEPGVSYRASCDPRPIGRRELSDVLTLDFSLPREQSASLAEVKRVFPSSDDLPENLLRFYVFFSHPMRRGRVEAEISVLGSDGGPAADVLYRAPVELWDKSMQCLTILLDPGRLKRGVGPNRELGPPLKVGQEYTLAIGSGIIDSSGRPLRGPFHKRFRVGEAVRERVTLERWQIDPPQTKTRQPLVLTFPRPLDRALLSQTITVVSGDEQVIEGRIAIDQCETRWTFTPTFPWASGHYHIRVSSNLEDVCGNSMVAAFDRPLRPGSDLVSEVANRSVPFELA
jgi:hypothetical protein